MNEKTRKIVRVAIAACLGLIIFCVSLNTGVGGVEYHLRMKQKSTAKLIKIVADDVNEYQKRRKQPPQSLREVAALLGEKTLIQENGDVFDADKNKIVYQRRGANYVLISYGRDGKPGGVGLDRDLSSDDLQAAKANIPFRQVVTNPAARGIVGASLFSAIVTFLLSFFLIKPTKFSFEDVGCAVLQIAVTLFATFIFASFIALLHIPTGH